MTTNNEFKNIRDGDTGASRKSQPCVGRALPDGGSQSNIISPASEKGKGNSENPEVPELREGDNGASRVIQSIQGRPLLDEEAKRAEIRREEEKNREIEKRYLQYRDAQEQFWTKSRWYAKAIRVLALAVAFLLMLVLTDRILTFAGIVLQLPSVLQWVAWGFISLLALLFILLLYSIMRMLFFFKVATPEDVVWVKSIDTSEGYGAAKKYWEKAQEHFRMALENYETESEALLKSKKACLAYAAGPKSWVINYDKKFLTELDALADVRIAKIASSVGILTATSPIKLVDQITIITHSFSLTKELMTLYGVRPKFGDVLFSLLSILTHTAAGEYIQEGAEKRLFVILNG